MISALSFGTGAIHQIGPSCFDRLISLFCELFQITGAAIADDGSPYGPLPAETSALWRYKLLSYLIGIASSLDGRQRAVDHLQRRGHTCLVRDFSLARIWKAWSRDQRTSAIPQTPYMLTE